MFNTLIFLAFLSREQPPSGGCVLKLNVPSHIPVYFRVAATFGWLCVETLNEMSLIARSLAATFGWLCVETRAQEWSNSSNAQPPSGGCVLKQARHNHYRESQPQPPSGGCVLKQV